MLLSEDVCSTLSRESYEDYLAEVFEALTQHCEQQLTDMVDQQCKENVDYAIWAQQQNITALIEQEALKTADEILYDSENIQLLCQKCYAQGLHPLECVDEICQVVDVADDDDAEDDENI